MLQRQVPLVRALHPDGIHLDERGMIRNARRDPRNTRIRLVLPVPAIRLGDGEVGRGPADERV